MGATSGRTTVVNLALDLLALAAECRGSTSTILAGVDTIENEDRQNDPLLIEALKALERAIEFDEGVNRQASLLQAKSILERAIAMDLAEMGPARLRAVIMPLHHRTETSMEAIRAVIGRLSQTERRAA